MASYPFDYLTNREKQVLVFAAKGYTGEETARALKVSVETVKSHRRSIIAKTKADNMTQAVYMCSAGVRAWSRRESGKRRLYA